MHGPMTGQQKRKRDLVGGLARAARALAASGSPSALEISRTAMELAAGPETLAAHCRTALELYDLDAMEDAARAARASGATSDALEAILAQIHDGPLSAKALADRLAMRGDRDFDPVSRRIMYVVHKSPPMASDGYAIRTHGLARGLVAQGVDLVCVTRPGFPYDVSAGGERTPARDRVDELDGMQYHRLASPSRTEHPCVPVTHMVHASFAYLEQAADRLAEAIRLHRPSCVVAASNHATAIPACLAARGAGLPFVYEVRGFWELSHASRDPAYLRSIAGRQERFLEIATARAADAIITLNEAMREELVARDVAPERIYVVANSCDPDRFRLVPAEPDLRQRLGLKEDVPVIGYIGSFNSYEGLDDLVRACATLKREGLRFRLMLVGSEPADRTGAHPVTTRIRRAVAETGLGDWLLMPGRIAHKDVATWYALVDIAPFPRRSRPVSELVPPLKPLEAMALGKAVVVSSVAGMHDMVREGQTGLVVAKDDIDSLTEALRTLLHDPQLRRRMGAAARVAVQSERSWRHAAGEMLDALTPLL